MGAEATIGPWLGNLFYIVGGVYLILRMLDMFRRKPHVDVDFSSIKTDLEAIKSALINKQDATLCATLHRHMDDSIKEIRKSQGDMERKQSSDVHGIYSRLENIANSVSEDIGSLKGTINTYIKLREKS